LSLAVYFLTLLVFTLFPRPLLESGNPSEIEEFLRTHANIFYKILYADTSLVYIGNYFLLFPFALLISWVFSTWTFVTRFFCSVLISGFIEITQIWIPGRVSDPVDFLSNVLGAAIGLLLYETWLRRKS
jgi:glycopeptide antibiotics resistance protein